MTGKDIWGPKGRHSVLRITMMHVLRGDATINPSAAKPVLSVVLLFPAVVGLHCDIQHQLDRETGAEVWGE